MTPTIRFTPEEHASESVNPDTLLVASELFRVNGVLFLQNILSPKFIKTLHASFIKRHRHYFYDRKFRDALPLGDKRLQITVKLQTPFNTPLLYANPLVFPIIKQILGVDCILGAFGAAVSLPGAEDQSVHKDYPRLFHQPVDTLIPSFAISMMIPLVNLNDINGTTRVWRGSNIASDEGIKCIQSEDPHVPIGSCYLLDYKLLHQGTANRSKKVRPILYNTYCRPWFRDSINFRIQPTVQTSSKEYKKVSEAHRGLFSIAEIGRKRSETEDRRRQTGLRVPRSDHV